MKRRFARRKTNAEKERERVGLDGAYYRSKWERNIARWLNWLKARGEIYDWGYEVEEFWFNAIKRGTRSYRPDFKVWDSPEKSYFYEVKGYLDNKSVTALTRMYKYYPEIPVLLIRQVEYDGICAQCAGILEGWEK